MSVLHAALHTAPRFILCLKQAAVAPFSLRPPFCAHFLLRLATFSKIIIAYLKQIRASQKQET